MIAADHALALVVTLTVSHVSGQATRPAPLPIQQAAISAPETLVDLKTGDLKGIPTRLAWAPDGAYLYLRVSKFDRWANETVSHVQLELGTHEISWLEREPAWARRYWNWKSAASSPAQPAWRIKFESRQEKYRTTNVPGEGGIGQHSADPNASLDEIVRKAALANQMVTVETLTLGAIVLEEGVNRQVFPGRTFSWAPAPSVRIAYVNDKGHLVIAQHGGHSREVEGTDGVQLPAWSEDGSRIVFFEQKNDTYVLRVVAVR